MDNTPIKVLLVEDDEDDYIITRDLLSEIENERFELTRLATYDEALAAIGRLEHDVYLLDYRLDNHTGLELLREAVAKGCPAPLILLTGQGDHEIDLEAMKAGAADYLVKGQISSPLLSRSIRYAIEQAQTLRTLRASVQQLKLAYEQATSYAQKLHAEITERKRAELALEEARILLARRVAERTAELSAVNAELIRTARLKDEFLANMSHELRTPLNAVLGLSEVLLNQIAGPLTEQQVNFVQMITESGHHLLALINDILDVSKIEAGKLDLQLGRVSVEKVCRAGLQFINQTAFKKRINISFQMDPPQAIIQADERRLKQILVNLLSNAIKFTPEGGQVGLEVISEPAQEVIHFIVWDTGVGISSKDLPRLFKSFVQLDGSLSRQYDGVGLGLVLVSRLAELHGGCVSVESEVNRGSRFTVSLPWLASDEAAQQPGQVEVRPDDSAFQRDLSGADTPLFPSPPPGEQTRMASHSNLLNAESPLILLAEDNEANIRPLVDYLANQGYRVSLARNGVEVIDRARKEQPALILMDIQMPRMDGLEAIRHLRAEAHLATIPIIALTALAMPGDRERCLAAGADDYLSKPVSLKTLVSKIQTYLEPTKVR